MQHNEALNYWGNWITYLRSINKYYILLKVEVSWTMQHTNFQEVSSQQYKTISSLKKRSNVFVIVQNRDLFQPFSFKKASVWTAQLHFIFTKVLEKIVSYEVTTPPQLPSSSALLNDCWWYTHIKCPWEPREFQYCLRENCHSSYYSGGS